MVPLRSWEERVILKIYEVWHYYITAYCGLRFTGPTVSRKIILDRGLSISVRLFKCYTRPLGSFFLPVGEACWLSQIDYRRTMPEDYHTGWYGNAYGPDSRTHITGYHSKDGKPSRAKKLF